MWRVLVQQLSILKSTRSPALIAVNGVPVTWLLNQLPGSSVRFIVSTESARVVRGIAAHNVNVNSKLAQIEKIEWIFFMEVIFLRMTMSALAA